MCFRAWGVQDTDGYVQPSKTLAFPWKDPTYVSRKDNPQPAVGEKEMLLLSSSVESFVSSHSWIILISMDIKFHQSKIRKKEY